MGLWSKGSLSYARHFPAINWIESYSLYQDKMDKYFDNLEGDDFSKNRIKAMQLLQDESGLQEIVRLVGADSLSDQDQLKLEVSKMIREDFLQQNSFHEVDTYCPIDKQKEMLGTILDFYDLGLKALDAKIYMKELLNLDIREKIARMKYINNDSAAEEIKKIREELKDQVEKLIEEGGVLDA